VQLVSAVFQLDFSAEVDYNNIAALLNACVKVAEPSPKPVKRKSAETQPEIEDEDDEDRTLSTKKLKKLVAAGSASARSLVKGSETRSKKAVKVGGVVEGPNLIATFRRSLCSRMMMKTMTKRSDSSVARVCFPAYHARRRSPLAHRVPVQPNKVCVLSVAI
jgi:hypothetical protein